MAFAQSASGMLLALFLFFFVCSIITIIGQVSVARSLLFRTRRRLGEKGIVANCIGHQQVVLALASSSAAAAAVIGGSSGCSRNDGSTITEGGPRIMCRGHKGRSRSDKGWIGCHKGRRGTHGSHGSFRGGSRSFSTNYRAICGTIGLVALTMSIVFSLTDAGHLRLKWFHCITFKQVAVANCSVEWFGSSRGRSTRTISASTTRSIHPPISINIVIIHHAAKLKGLQYNGWLFHIHVFL
mmetsp:Transcript_9886/g.23370  ORF Transcript_9886/g.23370 Transcript_9886/m.23370 type:complete len:240 (-) Transcript_9886:611-1330(-)